MSTPSTKRAATRRFLVQSAVASVIILVAVGAVDYVFNIRPVRTAYDAVALSQPRAAVEAQLGPAAQEVLPSELPTLRGYGGYVFTSNKGSASDVDRCAIWYFGGGQFILVVGFDSSGSARWVARGGT